MEQLRIIKELKELLLEENNIETALLFGSFARENPTVNSDIDIALIVKKYFDKEDLILKLQKHFSLISLKIIKVDLRNKIVIYFNNLPKIEIIIGQFLSDHNRNYLGSEIPYDKISNSILFDKSKNACNHLISITKEKEVENESSKEAEIMKLIDKFLYEFESCSNKHKRSDGYQFYFFFNIALQIVIQLNHLSKGYKKFNFLPKNFISEVLTKEEQKHFYDLNGELFLPNANNKKRKLLDFFYSSIQNLIKNDKLIEIKLFCETIYDRDFLWNFRDISLNNPKIKNNIIYRTATMTLFQNENFFEGFILEKKIKTVIDLRANREILESNYTEKSLQNFNWVHAPFDPWNQSIEFQTIFNTGSNIEIAYRFFGMECKNSIKKIVESILQDQGSFAIHCHAGKDRTGIVISILHLLSDADLLTVYNDYLATEMDTKIEYLDIFLEIINNENGVNNYLISCGLSQNQILQLKNKISK